MMISSSKLKPQDFPNFAYIFPQVTKDHGNGAVVLRSYFFPFIFSTVGKNAEMNIFYIKLIICSVITNYIGNNFWEKRKNKARSYYIL